MPQQQPERSSWSDPMEEDGVFDREFAEELGTAVLDDIEPIPFRPPQHVTSRQAEFLIGSEVDPAPIEPIPFSGVAPSHFHGHFATIDMNSYGMFDNCEDCVPSEI